jgi:hypothetical protein
MNFDLKDVLQTIGPNAGLLFAAWIFLQFVQTRYIASYDQYRALIDLYRGASGNERRRGSLGEEIFVYRRRCEQMRIATNLGVASAIALITSLVAAALTSMLRLDFLKFVSAPLAIIGLLLVAAAAVLVYKENNELRSAMDRELSDLPDLGKRLRRSARSSPAERGG